MQRVDRGLVGDSFDLQGLLGLRFAAAELKLRSHQRSRAVMFGRHASKIRGRGMSFSESRPYQPGDDVRLIDWRVTARSTRTHTKVFEEEKQRPVFLVMDFTQSMFFGTRRAFKHVAAAEAAATVAWSCVGGGDHVGGLLVSPASHSELKPKSGRPALMRFFHALLDAQQHRYQPESVRINDALKRAIHVVRPGSLVLVFSDFYQFDEKSEQQLVRLKQHNDLILCQVLDPVEIQSPPAGRYPVSNGTNTRLLDSRGAEGERLAGTLEELQNSVRRVADRHRFGYGLIRTDQSVLDQIKLVL